MPGSLVTRTLSGARVLRRLPVARLLALADVIVLAREHLNKLEPHERRRLVELAKMGRFHRGQLTRRERRELTDLLAKTEPRMFLNRAAQKVTGVPIPRQGRGRR
jgi:hypothetical protein